MDLSTSNSFSISNHLLKPLVLVVASYLNDDGSAVSKPEDVAMRLQATISDLFALGVAMDNPTAFVAPLLFKALIIELSHMPRRAAIGFHFNVKALGDRAQKAISTPRTISAPTKGLNGEIDVNASTLAGRTFLMIAAAEGDDHMLSLLILKGADRDRTDVLGFTALHYAEQTGHAECQKLLKTAGQVSLSCSAMARKEQ